MSNKIITLHEEVIKSQEGDLVRQSVEDSQWGTKVNLNMKHLETMELESKHDLKVVSILTQPSECAKIFDTNYS